jgi:hypothetical protein
MKSLILTAALGTAALGLAACDNAADDVDEGDTTVITEEPAPVVTETTVVDDPDADVDIDVDDPDVQATIGSDPEATITVD